MREERLKREEILDVLRAELARLLCADDVSEEEKLIRIERAERILQGGEVLDG